MKLCIASLPVPDSISAVCLLLLGLSLPLSIAGANIALGGLTGVVLWRWSQGRPPAIPPTALLAALSCYLAVGCLSAWAGPEPAMAWPTLRRDLHKIWVVVIVIGSSHPGSDRWLARGLGVGFLASAVIGLLQTLLLRGPVVSRWIRPHAFVHPVTFGILTGLGLLGAVCWLLSTADKAPRGRWAAAALLVLAGTLFLNQTRGAWLGLAAGAAALAAVDARARRWALWGALGLFGAFVLMDFLPTGRSVFGSFLTYGTAMLEPGGKNPQFYRVSLWCVAWMIFLAHPWLGCGPGRYRALYPQYSSLQIEGEVSWGSAHNLYFHQLAERGAVGLLALAGLLAYLTRRAWQRLRQRANFWNLWAFSGLVAFLVMNLTEVAFESELAATMALVIWTQAESCHQAPAS